MLRGPWGVAHMLQVQQFLAGQQLKKEIETQNLIKDELEVRANVAEKKIHELNLKLKNLQKKKKKWC